MSLASFNTHRDSLNRQTWTCFSESTGVKKLNQLDFLTIS